MEGGGGWALAWLGGRVELNGQRQDGNGERQLQPWIQPGEGHLEDLSSSGSRGEISRCGYPVGRGAAAISIAVQFLDCVLRRVITLHTTYYPKLLMGFESNP